MHFQTYKVCGEGFVRKGNLIAFGLEKSFFFSNAIGFCQRFKALLKMPIGLGVIILFYIFSLWIIISLC